MRFRLAGFLFLALSLPAASMHAHADPGHGDTKEHSSGVVTDDPFAGETDAGLGFDGAGVSSVEKYLGEQAPATRAQRRGRDVSLIGAWKGEDFNEGIYADVWGYKNLAFVGKWRGGCPANGVDIIDISAPTAPVKIADTGDYPDTSMEDMQAIQVGDRDVLAIGLQDCGNNPTPGVGQEAFELYDITNPASPQLLSKLDLPNGNHELDLTTHPSGKTLALLSSPDAEALTSDANGVGGLGDMIVVDITNPDSPAILGEWGVLDEPSLGVPFYLSARQGADARTQLHSVRANVDGTRAYLSYWDAGYIILDLTDPTTPKYVGRTAYAPGDEGNAHSVDEARGGNILVAADEDFSPFEFRFTSSAFSGTRVAVEAAFTPAIVDLPSRAMEGTVVQVGRGCPAGSINGTNLDDPYLGNPAGAIALIERGACAFSAKIARAEAAGATGVIVYNSAAGGEGLVRMGPTAGFPAATKPAVFVARSTGLLLVNGTPPVTARAAAEFNGWGYLRIYDIKDPANPKQLSTFATPNTNNAAVATTGTWSVHNPEVRGNTLYASWYSDGIRIIDISNPARPREIGFWAGAGAPADAPAVNVWSVVPHGDQLLVSDRNYGLYILKQVPGK